MALTKADAKIYEEAKKQKRERLKEQRMLAAQEFGKTTTYSIQNLRIGMLFEHEEKEDAIFIENVVKPRIVPRSALRALGWKPSDGYKFLDPPSGYELLEKTVRIDERSGIVQASFQHTPPHGGLVSYSIRPKGQKIPDPEQKVNVPVKDFLKKIEGYFCTVVEGGSF